MCLTDCKWKWISRRCEDGIIVALVLHHFVIVILLCILTYLMRLCFGTYLLFVSPLGLAPRRGFQHCTITERIPPSASLPSLPRLRFIDRDRPFFLFTFSFFLLHLCWLSRDAAIFSTLVSFPVSLWSVDMTNDHSSAVPMWWPFRTYHNIHIRVQGQSNLD